MKKLFIPIVAILAIIIIAGTIVGAVYVSGQTQIKLSEIGLEKERIKASMDSQRLIAAAYDRALSTVFWILGLSAAFVLGLLLVLSRAVESGAVVMQIGPATRRTRRIERTEPPAIDYSYPDERYCGPFIDPRGC